MFYIFYYYVSLHLLLNIKYFNIKYNCKIVSLIHSVISSALSIYHLCSTDYNNFSNNDTIDNIILIHSLSYFILDTFKCLYFSEITFFFHHLFSVLYILSSYLTSISGKNTILGILLGEISNPFLHCGWLLKYHKKRMYIYMWYLNTIIFGISRLIFSPVFIYDIILTKTTFMFQKYILIISWFLFFSTGLVWIHKQIESYKKQNISIV